MIRFVGIIASVLFGTGWYLMVSVLLSSEYKCNLLWGALSAFAGGILFGICNFL